MFVGWVISHKVEFLQVNPLIVAESLSVYYIFTEGFSGTKTYTLPGQQMPDELCEWIPDETAYSNYVVWWIPKQPDSCI